MKIRGEKILSIIWPALALLLLPAGRAWAGFTINSATVSFNNGAEFKTSTITINSGGVLNGGGAWLEAAYSWENNGAFNAGASTVAFGGTGPFTLAGNNTFYSLVAEAAGSTITFAAGSVQVVAGQFQVRGALGNSLKLRSSSEGNKWSLIFPNGEQAAEYVDVKDSDALLNAITAYNSKDSGNNNTGWVFPPGCAAGATVAGGGGADYTTITAALTALDHDLTADTCVIILDTGPYNENVNVMGFTTNGYRLKIMAAESFTSSGPVISPASGEALTIVEQASVTIQGLFIQPAAGNGIKITTSAYFAVKQTTITLNSAAYAGLSLWMASTGAITETYISNPAGDAAGFLQYSDQNEISEVYFGAGGYQHSAIYTEDSSSNTFTGIYVYNPADTGYGVHFKTGGYNTVLYSTLTAYDSANYNTVPLYIESGTNHRVEHSFITNSLSGGAWLISGGIISFSTITSQYTTPTVKVTGAGNSVADCYIYNSYPGAGTAKAVSVDGGGELTIEASTITSIGGNDLTVYSNTTGWGLNILNSYVYSASTAVYVIANSACVINSSTISTTGAGKSAVQLSNVSNSTVSYSSLQAGGSGGTALYADNVTYSTVAYSSLAAGAGTGLYFTGGNNNQVLFSTVTAQDPVYADNLNYSTVAYSSLISAGGGTGLYFTGGGGNYVLFSTVTADSAAGYAVYAGGLGTNAKTMFAESFFANTSGTGVYVYNKSYEFALSSCTVRGGGDGYYGVYLQQAQGTNNISNSDISGSTAAYAYDTTTSQFTGNTLKALSAAGVGLGYASGCAPNASDNTISGGADGIAINLGDYTLGGAVGLSSNTVRGGAVGLSLPNAAITYSMDSLNFQELSPGATAIVWRYPSPLSLNFAGFAFNSPEMAVNVDGSLITSGGPLTFTRARGPRSGTLYERENGDADNIQWDALPTGCYHGFNVAGDGSQSYESVQAAVLGLGTVLSTTTCVAIKDSGSYEEQVTVGDIDTAGHRLYIRPFAAEKPIISPPALSTAAFRVLADSVTVQGLKILPTGAVSYGVLASSANFTASSLSVVSDGNIVVAGMQVSSYSLVEYSSITVQSADGLWLTGTRSTVAYSTAAASGSGYTGLYLAGASSNTVKYSNFYSAAGYGAELLTGSGFNEIFYSTMTGTTGGKSGLYIQNSASNTVTQSYLRGPGGALGAALDSGAHANAISYSTITGSGLQAMFIGSSSNTITASYLRNTSGGYGLTLNMNSLLNHISSSVIRGGGTAYSGLNLAGSSNTLAWVDFSCTGGYGASLTGKFNTISHSTMTGAGVYPGLYMAGADSNTITGSYIYNPTGPAAHLLSSADFNEISYSTMNAGGSGTGLLVELSSASQVAFAYISGATAAYVTGSSATVISGSTFTALAAGGYGLLADYSVDLTAADSVFSGGGVGAGLSLGAANKGLLSLSTNIVAGGAYGLEIGAQDAAAQLFISSITFQTLTAGATAINFTGGELVSVIARAQFDSPAISVNVNGSALEAGSLITMRRAAGIKGGPDYENDPYDRVSWGPAALLVGPGADEAGVSQSLGLHARAPGAEQGFPLQYHFQVDIIPGMDSEGGSPAHDLEQAAAQAVAEKGAFSGQDAAYLLPADAYLYYSTATFVFYSTGTQRLAGPVTYFWRARAREAGDTFYGDWTSTASFTTGTAASTSPVNDIAISGVNLYGPAVAGTVNIGFTIAENNVVNSQTPNGAFYNTADWVFVKFSTAAGADGTWNHATLTGAAVDAGASYAVASDSAGVFLNHIASAAYWTAGATVTWNFLADGVSFMDEAVVKVFAISMVKVPAGSFVYNAGNIGGSNYNNISGPKAVDSDTGDDLPASAPAGWPNGYNSFYIMRYELTQGQYADFLNSIPSAAASTLYSSDTGYGHQMSDGGAYPNKYSAVDRFAAKNYLSTSDLWSYLSWATLRPLTEMEFEKAARDVGGDSRTYPWGNTAPPDDTTTGLYSPRNEGGTHKKHYMNFRSVTGGQKVLDVGRYMSGDVYRTPEQTGASPYGIADLAGNVYEHILNCSYLSVPGNGNGTTVPPPGWPAANSSQKGLRGGVWGSDAVSAQVSDRYNAGWTDTNRYSRLGGRGGRTQ